MNKKNKNLEHFYFGILITTDADHFYEIKF